MRYQSGRNVAAVIFHPEKISEAALQNKLNNSGDVRAEKIEFPSKVVVRFTQ